MSQRHWLTRLLPRVELLARLEGARLARVPMYNGALRRALVK